MLIFYENQEYESGKHKIRKVWAEALGINKPDIPNGCSVIEFDEFYNRKLAQALITNSDAINDLPDKIYINNSGQFVRNDTQEVVTVTANPQKESYKLSQLYGLTHEQLDNHIDGISNLAEAKEFMRRLAHVTLWLVKQTKLDE